jgi:predicted transcriptional regulator
MNKPTPTPKEAALAAISALPDKASFEEIACRLHVLEAIREGEEDIAAGRSFPHEEVVADLEKWLSG